MAATLPEAFGHYRVVRALAGQDVLADDTRQGIRVVVRLLPFSDKDDLRWAQKCQAQARQIAQIHHPHLCPVLDVCGGDGIYYLILPVLEGTPLEQRLIPDHPWPARAALLLIRQLASVVHRLHQNHIVHQQLHPAHVLLRVDGNPVLTDFGLAACIPAIQGSGSVLYRAPEQLKGDAAKISPATDVWALAVLLYQLLTGQHPFAAPIETEVRARIQHLKVPPPSAVRPGLDRRFDVLFERLLNRNLRQRPASMTELSELLGTVDELPTLVPLPGSVPLEIPVALEIPAPSLLDIPEPPPLPARNRKLVATLGVSVAAVVLAVVLGVTSGLWLPGTVSSPGTPVAPAEIRLKPLEEMTIRAGQAQSRSVRIERTNCDSEIQLECTGTTSGISVQCPPIAAGDDKSDIVIQTSPRTRPGAYRLRLIARGPGEVRSEGELTLQVQPELKLAKRFKNAIGLELVLVPAGKYQRGSPSTEPMRNPDEGPQHDVEITQPFYLGAYEVTQKEYQQVMESNPSAFRKGGEFAEQLRTVDTDRLPVENVTWEQAVAFCKKLSDQEDEKKHGRLYRLPTEAEWEYACRAGAKSYQVFHFGDKLSSREANFEGNYPYGGAPKGPFVARPVPVDDKKYKANAFGLYHMHGNVWEWCSDWHEETRYRTCLEQSLVRDPPGPERGQHRVLRGGSWYYNSWYCRSAARFWVGPGDRLDDVGFRVVCVVTPP